MTVLAAWGPHARELVASRLPNGEIKVDGNTALAFTSDEVVDGTAIRVGSAPTDSWMSTLPHGLVVERGPAWTAPIYYRADKPIVSSHLSMLVEDRDEIDGSRLATIVGDALRVAEDRTVYHNVRVVCPLETVVFSSQGRKNSFRAVAPLEQFPDRNVEDLADELRRRLVAAVKRATGERRVGLMLSGGLDSSAVLAALLMARGARPSDVHVTLDFDARDSDRAHVRALETHFGIVVTRLAPRESAAHDALVMDHAPSRHHGDPWLIACARAAHARGAEILLTGAGGDQLFGGDLGAAVRNAVSQTDFSGAFDALRASFPYRASARLRATWAAKAFLRPYVPRWAWRRRARRTLDATPDWLGPIAREEIRRVADEYVAQKVSTTAQERYEAILQSPYEAECIGIARAQTDGASPIPRVDPIYDDGVVKLLMGVPHQTLFTGGTYRGLLRLAMRGFLPESVRGRLDKASFEPALADAIPFSQFESLLTFELLERAGIVHARKLQAFLAPLYAEPDLSRNGSLWLTLWPALACEAFLRSRS